VFFPDKLLFTFLIGLILGFYYQKKRLLLLLMITHWIMDLWSIGIFFTSGKSYNPLKEFV
jgi:membrane protease YdiL (CAAX protease family)